MSAPAEPPAAWEKIIASYAYKPTGAGGGGFGWKGGEKWRAARGSTSAEGESGSCAPPRTPPLRGKTGAGRLISSARKNGLSTAGDSAVSVTRRRAAGFSRLAAADGLLRQRKQKKAATSFDPRSLDAGYKEPSDSDPFPSSPRRNEAVRPHTQDPGFNKIVSAKKRKRGKLLEGDPSGRTDENGREKRSGSSRGKNKSEEKKGKDVKGKTGKRLSRRNKIVVISPYFASSAEKLIQREAEKGNSVEVVVWKRPQMKKTEKSKKLEGDAKMIEQEKKKKKKNEKSKKLEGDETMQQEKKKKKKTRDPSHLTAAEKMKDAYKRVTDDNRWSPPFSEYDLLQEFHFFDHWRVLVICMLLNRTTGQQVRRILPRLFLMCTDAESAVQTTDKEIEDIIRPLGLQNKRSKMIKRMSEEYLSPDWTHVTQLHGIGKYAADAYAIFCSGKWKDVKPNDHKLVDYWRFLMEDFDARMSITVQQSPSSLQTQ